MSHVKVPMPGLTPDDAARLERAKGTFGTTEPTEEVLRAVAASEGIDVATAALYAYLVDASRHRAFIAGIAAGDEPRVPASPPRLIVVPGAFHAEYPHTGADGQRVLDLAAGLGWPAERLATRSFAPMAENSAALVRLLSREPGRPTILVSLSKGSADVREALARPAAQDELRDVRTWVSFSGMSMGTPLVDWLRSRPLRYWGVRLLLLLRRQRAAALHELRRAADARLSSGFTLPRGLRAIHVLSFPLVPHLRNDWARRGHARLAPLGPNDGGGVLLADALHLPGDVLPVWGADHYLRPDWDARPLLLRVLREAARE